MTGKTQDFESCTQLCKQLVKEIDRVLSDQRDERHKAYTEQNEKEYKRYIKRDRRMGWLRKKAIDLLNRCEREEIYRTCTYDM